MWLQYPSVALALLAATTFANTSLEPQIHQPRKLEAEFGFTSLYSCKCKSKARHCLFIHGEVQSEENSDLQTKSSYFGDIKNHAPCCLSIKYVSLDTTNNAWTNEDMQETVCKHALALTDASDEDKKIIKNTILVTHSMGALILAGAVANEKCSLDKNSTSWVSMSAPMLGTMASDTVQNVCSPNHLGFVDGVLLLLGQCPVGEGMKSLAYQEGEYADKNLNEAYGKAQAVYREYVTAAMCSNGYQGIFSSDQIKYATLAISLNHNSGKNDGIVTYDSCRGGLEKSKFRGEPGHPFYVSKCNHADTRFLHGNDMLIDSKKPVRWFECAL